MVTSITLSAANANRLWVTFGGYNAPSVFVSTNFPGNWSAIGGIAGGILPGAVDDIIEEWRGEQRTRCTGTSTVRSRVPQS
jgi:hypothetical protein